MLVNDSRANNLADDLLAMLMQENKVQELENKSNQFLSKMEMKILRSLVPIEVHEFEEVNVVGYKGIIMNKEEINMWKGEIPISNYKINEDQNPETIIKRINQEIDYVQEMAVRYLRPPTPPQPGDIIITQENNIQTGPAPPLIIRQQPPRPETPKPLIFREVPPTPPKQTSSVRITISGKKLPPPPRKVIIERLAPLPIKPQNIIIERWLPYRKDQIKRKVIFNKMTQSSVTIVKPRNVIIQWEQPKVTIKKEIKYLGVVKANPNNYIEKYGGDLKRSNDLPLFVKEIKTPENVGILASETQNENQVIELEGQLDALKHVDLEKEGLMEYKSQLVKLGIITEKINSSVLTSKPTEEKESSVFTEKKEISVFTEKSDSSVLTSKPPKSFYISNPNSNSISNDIKNPEIISAIFNQIDKDSNGYIERREAESIFLRINDRLGRSYGENDVKKFFDVIDKNKDGVLDIKEFKIAFNRIISNYTIRKINTFFT